MFRKKNDRVFLNEDSFQHIITEELNALLEEGDLISTTHGNYNI